LARATNTSVDGLVRGGVFKAVAGKARLLGPEDLAEDWDPATDARVSDWEVAVRLAKALSEEGIDAAARLMGAAGQRRDLDTVKELSYLLFSLSEKRGWAQTAMLFNGLGTTWNDLETAARSASGQQVMAQEALTFDDEN
jgi:putative DNA methylase